MNYREMLEAVSDAESTIQAFEWKIKKLGRLMRGRLRMLDYSTVAAFKKELKDFDARSWRWK